MSEAAKSDLRTSIRREATRLFAVKGYSSTSMREVAEACGCTKAALYYYYSSKDALFNEVIGFHAELCNEMLSPQGVEDAGVRSLLHRGLDKFVDYCISDPFVMQLLQRYENVSDTSVHAPAVERARQNYRQNLIDLMRRGVDSGQLRREMEPEDGAYVVLGVLNLLCEQSLASGSWDRPRIHRTIDLVLDGISA